MAGGMVKLNRSEENQEEMENKKDLKMQSGTLC